MQLRQVLTHPDFLADLSKASSKDARVSELKSLHTYAATLLENMKSLSDTQRFDIDFQELRVFHESQYTIHALNELVEKAKKNDISEIELTKLVDNFFRERCERILNTRSDYYPYVSTDANKLVWKLAEFLGKQRAVDPATIVFPTLKVCDYSDRKPIRADSAVILSEKGDYAISLNTFFNRLKNDQGLTYWNPVSKTKVLLTDNEKIRLASALLCDSNQSYLYQLNDATATYWVSSGVNLLREQAVKLLNPNISHGCDLLLVSSQFTKDILSDLPSQLNSAYVRSSDQLYYVNKEKNECIEIKLDQEKLNEFDKKMKPSDIASTLSTDQLKEISLITGHTLPNNAVRSQYYERDKNLYADILKKPWLIENPALLFEFMGYIPPYLWEDYVNMVMKQHTLAELNDTLLKHHHFQESIHNAGYYSDNANHNAAVLFFFAALYSEKRERGSQYNSTLPWVASFFSKFVADTLAFSKDSKLAAIKVLQTFLISGEPLTYANMKAWFVKGGEKQEALLPALCEAKSDTHAIVEQLIALENAAKQRLQQPLTAPSFTTVVKNGLFQEAKKNTPDVVVENSKLPAPAIM